jgi:hypothetical protein
MNVSGGFETIQWQVAPSYSALFGVGIRTTAGGYVTDTFALGAIIDYAEHREEYLANAGFQLNENMRAIGSFGLLKESEEFTLGEGRQDVQQLQYGLSVKGDYHAGLFRGYEINAYQTDASSDAEDVETGDLTGLQIVTALKPSDNADISIGAGYERAEWDSGEVVEGYTLQAIGSLQVSDTLSLNFAAKSGETEDSFGLGLTYDMSTAEVQNSALSISFNEIQGKHGISDDTRFAIMWTVGLGGAADAGADATVSSMGGLPSMTRTDLLADVMTRPAFLPERVLASLLAVDADVCPEFTVEFLAIDASGSYFWVSEVTLAEDAYDLYDIRWYLYKTDDPSIVIEGTYSESDKDYPGNVLRFQDPELSILYEDRRTIEARGSGCSFSQVVEAQFD